MDGPVLITGVSGFIGGHLAHRLAAAGARVRGLDVAPPRGPCVEFLHADLTRPHALVRALDGCGTVFHCARWSGRPQTWDAARAVDVTGTSNLLDAAERAGVGRVVHMSSIVVYGPTRAAVITEDTPHRPVGVYGTCKVEAEAHVRTAVNRGVPVVTLRPGQVYGPGARGGTLEPMRWIAAGRPALVGDGRGVIHPVYIDNLVDALLAAARVPGAEGRAFNIADGNVPWRTFYGHYARMCGRPLRSAPHAAIWLAGAAAEAAAWLTRRAAGFERAGAAYLTRRSLYATEKARAALGWTPRITMSDAMVETERWLRATGALPR